MKEQPEHSNHRGRNGFRSVYLIGFLAMAGVVVLAATFVFRGKSKPAAATTAASPPGAALDQIPATNTGGNEQASLQQLVRILNDSSSPLDDRKKAIQALAKNGSREAMSALDKALKTSPSEIRRVIAEALGECPSATAVAMLVELLKDSDVAVAKAAIQGLARQQQSQAASALAQLVNDAGSSADLRCDAALALGTIHEPWVLDPLSRAAKESDDADVAAAALHSIGGFDFSDTKNFFQDFLQLPNVSCDLQVAAVEAIAQAQGDPTAFLADLAAKSSDPEIRVAAAMGLSVTEVTGNVGPELLAMLNNEADPDVRLRLYQALRNQQEFDVNAALAMVQKESDSSARVAGYDLLAKTLRDNPNPDLQSFFDQIALPELKQIALNGRSMDERQAAIIALARAHSPQAMAVLGELRSQITPMQNSAPLQGSSTPGRQSTHPTGRQ